MTGVLSRSSTVIPGPKRGGSRGEENQKQNVQKLKGCKWGEWELFTTLSGVFFWGEVTVVQRQGSRECIGIVPAFEGGISQLFSATEDRIEELRVV